MALGNVLNTAITGLAVTQTSLGTVAQNITNANTVGYTRRITSQSEVATGTQMLGVRSTGVQRMLDILLQRQLNTETGGAGYTSTLKTYHAALDQLFGAPGGASSLDTIVNDLTTKLQTLVNDPSSYSNRSQTLTAATNLAQSINSIATSIQGMRQDIESQLSTKIGRANQLLSTVQTLNARIVGKDPGQVAGELDQRDAAITELSSLLDIKVTDNSDGGVSIFTNSGVQLFNGSTAAKLAFDTHSNIGAGQAYSTDPSQRGVGTITVQSDTGSPVDLIANNSIRSGELAALIQMRDVTLPQAQAQLDGLAAAMAQAVSNRSPASSAVTSGGASGFDIDIAGLKSGNTITVNYTDALGASRRVTLVRVEDASQLPLPATATADTGDQVVGVSFGADPFDPATAAAAIQSALSAQGIGLTVSNPTGTTLRVLDDGSGTGVASVSASITNTALTGSGAEFPLFVDLETGKPFTGSFDGGSQLTGFAQRIGVNPALTADPSKLVLMDGSTGSGDKTRPQLILDRLTKTSYAFSPDTGIGGGGLHYSGTIVDFAQRVVEMQGAAKQSADSLDQGQQVILSSIQSRYQEAAGVNVDTEMSNLIQLQNAYAANARVISAVKEMMDLLMNM